MNSRHACGVVSVCREIILDESQHHPSPAEYVYVSTNTAVDACENLPPSLTREEGVISACYWTQNVAILIVTNSSGWCLNQYIGLLFVETNSRTIPLPTRQWWFNIKKKIIFFYFIYYCYFFLILYWKLDILITLEPVVSTYWRRIAFLCSLFDS